MLLVLLETSLTLAQVLDDAVARPQLTKANLLMQQMANFFADGRVIAAPAA